MLRTKIEQMANKGHSAHRRPSLFVMAFEIMIMISPFAFFFYSVFNPIFHFLDSSYCHEVAHHVLSAPHDPASHAVPEKRPRLRLRLFRGRLPDIRLMRARRYIWGKSSDGE